MALVHSFYRSEVPSGENEIVLAQASLLEQAGFEVLLVGRSSDDHLRGPMSPLKAAWTVGTGRGPDPLAELRAFSPDVVHVHNLFPNFGDSWLSEWRGPIVLTLHNYRSLCANGLLFREGGACTLCPDGHPLAGVRHRCYRGSALATMPFVLRGRSDLRTYPPAQRADRVIALSPRSAATFLRYGADPDRLSVVPNWVAPVGVPQVAVPGERWITLGRLDPGKGTARLARSWPRNLRLDVVGEGPERTLIEQQSHPGIRLLGQQSRDWISQHLPEYSGLIFASLSPENSPLSVIEAFSCGVPVVARAGSAGADQVEAVDPGWVFHSDHELQSRLRTVISAGPSARSAALDEYRREYSEEVWLDRITSVYDSAVRAGG